MNQILDYGAGNNDNNSGKNKKPVKNNNHFGGESSGGGNNFNYHSNGGGKAPMSDKVVKVFAFLMILLAIALIASGVLSILKNKKDTTTNNANVATTPQVTAEILADLNQITGKVKITVNSPVTISKMIYSWDQNHDNVVAGEQQTFLEEEVVPPYGEHVLHVQVTDEQNNKTTKDFTFDSATGIDTTPPEITLTITEDKKLLVTATDDTSIAYVTYTWNNEEVVTMEPEEEGQQKLEFELDIPKGKNTIVVVAVDGSDSSNAKTTSKVLEGVTKPKIEYAFPNGDTSVVEIICSHENGIQSIYYTFCGQAYQWEASEGEEASKYLSFTQESVVGHNEMMITVTSVDGTTTEFNPIWDFGEVESSTDNTTTEDGER